MITIDGKTYNAEWVADSFTRKASILNGENSGRLQGNGDMFLEYIGTFFNFSGQIVRSANCSDKEWNDLFIALSNPINDHSVTVPFGNGIMNTRIYIANLEQVLKRISKDGKNVWSRVIDVSFTTMSSQWLAGGSLTGVVENG